jgi:hypoxanthine phosphoribosyltransferase
MTVLDKQFELFISKNEIAQSVQSLAEKIYADYADKSPTFLVILNGAFMFAGDLLKHYKGQCKVSFMRISSYEGTTTTGKIKTHIEASNIDNEDVIIVEDIVDTGNSLEFIWDYLDKKSVKSKKIVSLFHKPEAYKKSISIDYIGMNIPDKFILGYGLDYDGYGRNLPDVYQLKTT